jgi:hypothetical protein
MYCTSAKRSILGQSSSRSFYVRSYWSDGRRLHDGKFEQFASMESALRAGKAASLRSAGVRVCRVRGNPSADYWEDPISIARWGEVPPLGPGAT